MGHHNWLFAWMLQWSSCRPLTNLFPGPSAPFYPLMFPVYSSDHEAGRPSLIRSSLMLDSRVPKPTSALVLAVHYRKNTHSTAAAASSVQEGEVELHLLEERAATHASSEASSSSRIYHWLRKCKREITWLIVDPSGET